ncbi:SCO7613 C-terminal domain-containing membrane protein, partial [Plantactinospora solaniradicis]
AGYAFALLASAMCGLLALVTMEGPTDVLAGGPLLVTALLPIAAALLTRHVGFGATAGGVFVVVLAITLVRAVFESPWPTLCSAAVVAVGVAGLVAGTARLLPVGVRIGPRVGGLVVVSAMAVLTGVMTLVVAGAVVLRSLPVWQADPTAVAGPFDWQLPVALPLTVLALLLLVPRRAWLSVVLTGAVFTVLALPAAVPLPWWSVSAVDLAMVAAFALSAVWPGRSSRSMLPMAGAALFLAGHALLVGLARPAGAAAVLGGLVLIGVAIALVALRPAGSVPDHRRMLGGAGVALAVLGTPAAVTLGLFAADVPPWWQARAALASAVLLCAATVAVRRGVPHYLPYAGAALSVVALPVGLSPALPEVGEPPGMYAAGALLLTVAVLAVNRGRSVSPAGGAFSVPPLVSSVVLLGRVGVVVVPAVVVLLAGPYGWLGRIWSGQPHGIGLWPDEWRPDGQVALTLLLLTGTAAMVGWAWRAAVRPALLVAVPLAVTTALVGLAVAGARWPTVQAVSLLSGLAALLAVALGWRVVRPARVVVPLGVAFAGAGLAGLLPTEGSTLAGLALVVAVGLTAGAAGRSGAARVAGWLTAVLAGATLAVAGPFAADLPPRVAALVVLGVAALALAGGVVLTGRATSATSAAPADDVAVTVAAPGTGSARRAEGVAVEVASHVVAVLALVLTIGEVRHAAAVCTLWGVALGLRALRPAESAARRWAHAAAAGGAELVATWLLLSAARVALVEAYTLPAAVLGLLAGWLALRAWPDRSSWLAYGPGLGAALLPSLVSVLVAGDQPWRRLLLGGGALLAVLAGAQWRRQAPVLLGGGVLAALALREMVDVWDRLPRWIFLAVGGFVLIGLAMTYERRRRDLRRLRSAVGRMS